MKKSLYDLLRVPRDASNEEIKEAYAKQLARLQSEASSTDATEHNKFYKDAYDILSNPARRKQYDESLADKAAPQVIFVEENRGLDLKVIGLIGILILGGGWYYLDHSHEMERLKIERATQLVHEQQALEKERLEQQALAEQTRLGFTKQNMDQNQLQQERQQDKYYFDQLRQQEENAARRKKAEEDQQRYKEQREAEMQRSQAQADLARQKAWVERAERERYGYRR